MYECLHHTVMVKLDDISTLASIAENEQRAAMQSAEQIAGFRSLAEQIPPPRCWRSWLSMKLTLSSVRRCAW
jgi:hypothetical protein